MRDSLLDEVDLDREDTHDPAQLVTPDEWYRREALKAGFIADPAQKRAVGELNRLFLELMDWKAYRGRTLNRAFGRRRPPRGMYLWGGVGRGKSFLMDAFHGNLPYRRKRRVHFHHFMREVHEELKGLAGQSDPLQAVAKRIAVRYRVLCLDEFHVADIVDAMILARLLEVMTEHGLVLVTTSNYPPDGLYPHGLQREKFLPAIDLMNRNLDVLRVDGGTDYRLTKLDRLTTYHTPLGAEGEAALEAAFRDIAVEDLPARAITVEGREIAVKRLAPGVAWFDFRALCGHGRSYQDYLEIARTTHTVLVSGIPRMPPEMASEARRLTWLVDLFYDHRVKLLCTAEVAPPELYRDGLAVGEFHRTASRLQEMQSRQYLAMAHIA